jgi:hypothetical protein
MELRLRMPGVMHFNALWQQTFASALAPPGQSRASALRLHARTKTVLVFSSAL